MPKAKQSKTGSGPIAFVGDLHCGSHYGLWPLEELPPSRRHAAVRYLVACWERFVAECPPLGVLFLMGDLIDGRQTKARSTGLFTANLGEQVDGAIAILKPLVAKARLVLRVDGTPYHEHFDRALGKLDVELDVFKAAQVIDWKLPNGEFLNVAHHPSGGAALYQGTKLDRDGLWSMIAARSRKVIDARFSVRAHVHEYMMQETSERVGVLTPCWQLQTPYAKKGNYWRWQPSIGGVLMIEDPEHPGGYRFRPRLFDPPLPEVTNG